MSSDLIYSATASMGCDPELFLEKDGQVVPSFQAIPDRIRTGYGDIARDGVQVELQPYSKGCRQELAGCVASLLYALKNNLPDPGISFNLSAHNIEIPKNVFKKLDPMDRRLGCSPSMNIYGTSLIKVNPETYRRRSAGGHLHLGTLPFHVRNEDGITPEGKDLVTVLDVILGNTCVLIDRDPAAAIRRRVYGRAGEYRLPRIDRLEYRTLSNFWLLSPILFSMVLGIARQAIGIVTTDCLHKKNLCFGEPTKELLSNTALVNSCRKAINRNDLKLAQENWGQVQSFLEKWYDKDGHVGLNSSTIPGFNRFVQRTHNVGLKSAVVDGGTTWERVREQSLSYPSYIRGFESFARAQF